jgi:hypothetical protein
MKMTFRPNAEGIFFDLPATTYHQAPGVSNSMLQHMEPTPAHILVYMENPPEPTPAQTLGTLVHSRVLEPDKPLPSIVCKPDGVRFSTTEGKLWRCEQIAAGKVILEKADYDMFHGGCESIAKNESCREIFGADCKTEVSVFRNFNLGFTTLRKARIDAVPSGNALVDVKTALNASPEAFAKALLPRSEGGSGYAQQAAYYLDIWNDSQGEGEPKKECFLFVVVEKVPPYLVAVYNVAARAIGEGRKRNIEAITLYAECVKNGRFPGYAPGVQPLDFPVWFWKRKPNACLY